jgi:hypothetical protein
MTIGQLSKGTLGHTQRKCFLEKKFTFSLYENLKISQDLLNKIFKMQKKRINLDSVHDLL